MVFAAVSINLTKNMVIDGRKPMPTCHGLTSESSLLKVLSCSILCGILMILTAF